MKNKFLKEMNTSGVFKYDRPPLITLSGAPGSGKTELARELSRQLGVFVLSNDYIRNSFYNEIQGMGTEEERLKIQSFVERVNLERLLKLLFKRTPFVFDADLNSLNAYRKFELISKIFRYELIKIRIESSGKEENLRRIQGRVINLDDRDMSVIGDNMRYSGSYSEADYNNTLMRKAQVLPREYFDYCIFNIEDYDFFMEQVGFVSKDISIRRLTRI